MNKNTHHYGTKWPLLSIAIEIEMLRIQNIEILKKWRRTRRNHKKKGKTWETRTRTKMWQEQEQERNKDTNKNATRRKQENK